MELFPDEAHVRLRSRVHGTYLNAEEDGVGMGLRRLGASLNQAWAVHRLDRGGTTYVLLLGAAYGRYLAFVRDNDAPPGQGNNASHDCRFVQRVYDAPGQEDVLFEVAWAEDGSGDVLMRHCTFGWVHNPDNPTRMSWVVEAIPPLEDPPELPNVIPHLPVAVGGPIRRRPRVLPRRGQPASRRAIYYVRADDQGHVNNLVWSVLWFDGRSVFLLRGELAIQLGEQNPDSITLCVWGGSEGRRTPLVTDLPANEQPMHIIVLATESAAAEALVYPNVGAL